MNLEGRKERKVKVVPVNTMKAYKICKDITPHIFKLRALGGSKWSGSSSDHFNPRDRITTPVE